MKYMTVILILTMALAIIPAAAIASAPGGMPVIKADPEAAKKPKRQKSDFACHINGRVLCSEYGTRYKEPVVIVFMDGDEKYPAPLGEVDGSFQADLPANTSYTIRMEFQEKGYDIGRIDIPEMKEAGCSKKIEITHPGSMLELVWEIRDGQGPNIDLQFKDEKP